MFLSAERITKQSLFYVSVLTFIVFFSNVNGGFVSQSKIDNNTNQSNFNVFIRNTNASMIGCLHSLTVDDSSRDDNNACQDAAKLLDDFGLFLNDGENNSSLLKAPENADAYFSLMNMMQVMFCYLAIKNNPMGERIAKSFKTKHAPVYRHYLAEERFKDEGNHKQKEHFKPLVWAQTYYASVKAIEEAMQCNKSNKNADQSDTDTITRINILSKLIASAKDFGKKWPDRDDNFIFKYHGTMPFIVQFSQSYLREKYKNQKGSILTQYLFKPIDRWWRGKDSYKQMAEDSKKSKDGDINPEIIKANKIINKVTDNKKNPYTAMLMGEIYNQYSQSYLTIFPDIFRKLPTSKLTKDYFKNESDYRLYLFFMEPAHKLNFGLEKDNLFLQTSGLVEHYINDQLAPKMRDIEKKCKNSEYTLTKEDQYYIDDAHNYLLILLYAQICDSLWEKQMGEFMWPRNTNTRIFAGFNECTMSNIDYIASLYTLQKNNKR